MVSGTVQGIDAGQIRPLGQAAIAFRAFHATWAVLQLASLAYLWASAARRRRGRYLPFVVGFLLVEGGALVIGRGNCPLGPFQRTLGDPVPLFELVLPARAAKAAVPVLTGVTIEAMVAVALRPPQPRSAPLREGSRRWGIREQRKELS